MLFNMIVIDPRPLCRNFAVAASMFMNSNSLPIALMQSLAMTVPGLKWGKDDSKSAMLGRALTYLVLYSTLGMMVCPFRSICLVVILITLPAPMELRCPPPLASRRTQRSQHIRRRAQRPYSTSTRTPKRSKSQSDNTRPSRLSRILP